MSGKKRGWRARTAALLGLNQHGGSNDALVSTTIPDAAPAGATTLDANSPSLGLDYVLVVEDNALVRRLLEDSINHAGYRVESATNGVLALLRVMRGRPRLVVTDFRMPELDGVELIRALRAEPRFAEIPVILYTGSGREQVLLERLSGIPGVVHVMSKGNVVELLRTIASLVPSESFPGVLRVAGDT